MWLCTKLGFFSIVQKAPDEFHVRARCERDLVNLRKAVSQQVHHPASRWKIHRSEPADYRYRIVISKAYLQGVMQTLAMELDYGNFKSEIAQTDGQWEKLPIYSDFHHAMERWQNAAPSKGRKQKQEGFAVIEGIADPDAEHARRMRRLIPGIEDATD